MLSLYHMQLISELMVLVRSTALHFRSPTAQTRGHNKVRGLYYISQQNSPSIPLPFPIREHRHRLITCPTFDLP